MSSSAKPPSQRQLRVGELVRRALSDVFLRGETHEPDLAGVSITVSEVRMSPDLRIATAYVLPLGGRGIENVMPALKRARPELRRAVTKSVKLKFSPDLRFEIDETFDKMDDTRRMLGQERVRRDIEAPDDPEQPG